MKPTAEMVERAREWAKHSAAICVLDERLRFIASGQYAQALADEHERAMEECAKLCISNFPRIAVTDAEPVVLSTCRANAAAIRAAAKGE